MTFGDTHTRRAVTALSRLSEIDPALAVLSLWCRHRDSDIAGYALSDSTTIFYGPAYGDLSLPEQVGIAAHHVLHIAFRHAPRGAGLRLRFGSQFDARLYNLGADALVNDILVAAGHVLPRPFVSVSGLLDACDELAEADFLRVFDAERIYVRLSAELGRRKTANTGKDDEKSDWLQKRIAKVVTQFGFVDDLQPTADSTGTAEDLEGTAEWKQRLARALDVGRMSGRGLGSLPRDILEFAPSSTAWDVHLRRLVARAVTYAATPSFTRPSRRWIAGVDEVRRHGRQLPGFEPSMSYRREIPRIAIGLDLSGSIDEARLRLFATQIVSIGARAGAEMRVMAFDEEIRTEACLVGGDLASQLRSLALTGGGGTSFVEPVRRALEIDASVLVMLTDLDGVFGSSPAGLPVIWAVPDAASTRTPPFGWVVDLGA